MDEITGGRQPWSRRRHLLVAAVALLLLAGVLGERAARDAEVERLVAAVEQGEQAVRDSRAAVRSVEDYQAALSARADLPDGLRSSLRANVAQTAARWEQPVTAAAADVRGLFVLPWHDDVSAARDAYAERLDAWRALLAQTGSAGGGRDQAVRAVAATRRLAGERLEVLVTRAVPPLT